MSRRGKWDLSRAQCEGGNSLGKNLRFGVIWFVSMLAIGGAGV